MRYIPLTLLLMLIAAPAYALPVVIGAVVSAAGAWAAGATIGVILAVGATSLVLGAISYALAPKPKGAGNFAQQISPSRTAIRQPDLPRTVIYGHTRVSRGYAHMESTNNNKRLHMLIMLCDGELRAINEIWFNDYSIPPDHIDANGNVIAGRYAGVAVIRKHLGSPDQSADSLAVSNMSQWTANHRLQGIAYLYVILTKDQDKYPTGVPAISAVVEGINIYDPRTGEDGWNCNIALMAHDYIRNGDYGYAAREDDVDLDNVAAQANICDEIVDTDEVAWTASVVASTDIFTLTGDTLSLQFGDRVEVSSTGTLPAGLSAETPYYVIPYQIRTTPRLRLATSFENALDKTHIDIASAGTGTLTITKTGEPRYNGSYVVDREQTLNRNLNDIVSSMAGRSINVAGRWTLLAGAWRTPALSLDINDMRGGGISFTNSLTMAESFNVVKGLFISPETQYQTTDYPSAFYSQFVQEDGDIESPYELNLPATTRPTSAQRIAKIELFRGRQDIAVKCPFSMKALQVQPGDTVDLTIDRLGWDAKEFEVTNFSLGFTGGELIVNLSLRETAQAIYDWSSGEAITFDPAPNTNLTDPFDVVPPSGVLYSSRAIATQQGDEVYKLSLQWNLHPDAFVTQFGDFELQFKLSSNTEWKPSFFVDGSLTQTDVVDSSPNVQYDIRIRARNNLGVRSLWVTIEGAVVGFSGGTTTQQDWEFVTDPVGSGNYYDWGLVTDPVGSGDEQDWGYVA